ncbi:LysE family transporter [Tardisphaera miroshnichenkoae]
MIAFVDGLLMGFTLAAPPGPMNALIAQEATRSSKQGSLVGAGAMTADGVFFCLSFGVLYLVKPYVVYFYAVGGSFMVVLAMQTLRPGKGAQASAKRSRYLTGLAIGLSNPYQIGWWLSAGLSFMGAFGLSSIAGLFTALASWIIAFPLAIRVAGKRGGEPAAKTIKVLSAIALLAFGLYFIFEFVKAVL